MDIILINNSQDIQTEKSMATKLLNLNTHFSEIQKEWADAKSEKKKSDVAYCILLWQMVSNGLMRWVLNF